MTFAEFIDRLFYRLKEIVPFFSSKRRRLWMNIFFLGVLLIIFHVPVLQFVGNNLIDEDPPQKVDAICVLGGNTYDRTNKARELYVSGFSDKIVCVGANQSPSFESLGMTMPDAVVEKEQLSDSGVPDTSIISIIQGTSTIEELEAIKSISKSHDFKKLIVVSDLFHTKRIRKTINKVFDKTSIEVLVVGCSNSQYDEKNWWKFEQGLIMVNNEYIKLLYYAIKY